MTAAKTALAWSIPRSSTLKRIKIRRAIEIREDFAPSAKLKPPQTTVTTDCMPLAHASTPSDKIFANIADRPDFSWAQPNGMDEKVCHRTGNAQYSF